MLRYYMTSETRQALIAESNRMIATRAALGVLRRPRSADRAAAPFDTTLSAGESDLAALDSTSASLDSGEAPLDSESAFARLVSELASTAARSRLS